MNEINTGIILSINSKTVETIRVNNKIKIYTYLFSYKKIKSINHDLIYQKNFNNFLN